MSGVWDFIKRHRGKIFVGAVAAGGVYLAQQISKISTSQVLNSEWNNDQESSQIQLKVSCVFTFV